MEMILASQSPRRREILERMGLRDFKVVNPEVVEFTDDALEPHNLAVVLAETKAKMVQVKEGMDALIIAADTVVVVDGKILGKPADEAEAFSMLTALSGTRHQVFTGVTVLQGEVCHSEFEVTDVTFRTLSDEEINQYIATGESMDKAGAYGIQGLGALLILGIRGDYYNVMGLPLCLLAQMLKQKGIDCMALAAEKN